MPDQTTVRDSTANTPLRWSTLESTTLGLSVLSLAICCVLTSSGKYFEVDELFSWICVTDPSLSHMLFALYHGADGAPPLYHLTTRVWTGIFGRSELAFRSASSLAFMVALSITWVTVRRAFGRWPAAVATLFVFGLSELILHQVAEARFYGLLTALVATAVYLYTRAVAAGSISHRLLIATWLTHIALLYTHYYGLLYSSAILVAWVVNDRLSGRHWHAGYFAILLAWVAFLPWLPAAYAFSDISRPYNPNPVPTAGALLRAYGFSLHGTALILSLVLLLGALSSPLWFAEISPRDSPRRDVLRWRAQRVALAVIITLYGAYAIHNPVVHLPGSGLIARSTPLPGHPGLILLLVAGVLASRVVSQFTHVSLSEDGLSRVIPETDSLLLVGLGLLSIPLVSFVASHIGPPSFKTRYFIPAALGLAPVIAYFAWWSFGGRMRTAVPDCPPAPRQAFVTAARAALVIAMALLPVLQGVRAPSENRPGLEVEAVAPMNDNVVVESEGELLRLRHYQRRHDLTYVYPMDWAAASSAAEVADAAPGYKQMAIWGRVGYADSTMLSGANVPCSKTNFIVLNSRHAWFNDRILTDSTLTLQRIGVSHAFPVQSVIYLVRRRGTSVPAECSSSTISTP